MRLTDLLELLEPGTRVWIATGLDLEHDPEAELVAEDEVDRLRLFAVTGYWVDLTERPEGFTWAGRETLQQEYALPSAFRAYLEAFTK